MHIEMLSTGCSKSTALLQNIEAAVKEAGISAQVDTVNDIYKIMAYDISCCPAIAINGKIRSVGELLSVEEIVQLIA